MSADLKKSIMLASLDEKREVYMALKAFFSLRGEGTPLREIARHRSGAPIVSTAVLPDMTDEHLYVSIVLEQMKARGIDLTGGDRLRKTRGWASFYERIDGLNKFFSREPFTRREKIALLHIGVDLLIDALHYQGIPVSSANLLINYHRMPGLLDAAFPGYSEKRALRLVLRLRRE